MGWGKGRDLGTVYPPRLRSVGGAWLGIGLGLVCGVRVRLRVRVRIRVRV